MLPPPFHNALVLTGPTGSGKSALALELAEALHAEIVALDSMTLFRGMDIGTAKPSLAERSRVPHHLIDVLDPWESASVAWWLSQAGDVCRALEGRGKRALFVGGTPLYLKALLHGLFDGPPADLQLRQRLDAEAEQSGVVALHQRLATVDATSAARLHPNDVRRVVRALEVWELTGKPLSAWQTQWPAAAVAAETAPRILYLDLPRAALYARIEARVEAMFAAGLVEEVQALSALPRPWSRESTQALGYKQILAYLAGTATLAEVKTEIATRTRQFAKRQLTWFRHLPGCHPATKELTQVLWKPTI